ncbi:hypothetical protein [Streptomyces sp. WMMB303]|nr:hypothetical protein [Streptomyces sp. WMMB303]MDF4251217.1 hypothetical protein [Streptomyces sp. WMMB303]
MTWEIEVVEGEEDEVLARHQAEVMRDVLLWIVEQRREQENTETPWNG